MLAIVSSTLRTCNKCAHKGVPEYCLSEYNCLVRAKTSVTLSAELLQRIDRADSNRSAFLERAAQAYLAELDKARRNARDAEILNSNADRLNEEAADVLDYQGLP